MDVDLDPESGVRALHRVRSDELLCDGSGKLFPPTASQRLEQRLTPFGRYQDIDVLALMVTTTGTQLCRQRPLDAQRTDARVGCDAGDQCIAERDSLGDMKMCQAVQE